MILARFAAARFAILVLPMLALLLAGCDRVSGALDLTGNLNAVTPQPIGPERLRVVLPETGAQATLGPVAQSGDVTVWQTLDGITLSLRQGMLVATRGLGDDLMTADVSGMQTLLRGGGEDRYYPHIRTYLDGEDQTSFHSFQCRRSEVAGSELQNNRDQGFATKVQLDCISPRQTFTNVYWLSGSNDILKSRQWISPALKYMETERVLR